MHIASYNPRRDRWQEHFRLEGAALLPLTDRARTTIRLLQLNRSTLLKERPLWLAAGVGSYSELKRFLLYP